MESIESKETPDKTNNKRLRLDNSEEISVPTETPFILTSDAGFVIMDTLTREGDGFNHYNYKARDKATNQYVVLKKYELGEFEDGLDIGYLREISTLRKMNHPNIIKIKHVIINDKFIYMVTDFFPKVLIRELFRLKNSVELIKKVSKQLIQAVAYCHNQGIVHRDVKPDNVYLREDDSLVLADFEGSKRRSGSQDSRATTIDFQTVELMLGNLAYGFHSDIWALGITILYLICGKRILLDENKTFYKEQVMFDLFRIFGTPTEETLPGFSKLPDYKDFFPKFVGGLKDYLKDKKITIDPQLLDLLESMLVYNPMSRISAMEALYHPYFANEETYTMQPIVNKPYQIQCKDTQVLSKRKIVLDYLRDDILILETTKTKINKIRYTSYFDRCIDCLDNSPEKDYINLNVNSHYQFMGLICYIISYYLDYDNSKDHITEYFCDGCFSQSELDAMPLVTISVLKMLEFNL